VQSSDGFASQGAQKGVPPVVEQAVLKDLEAFPALKDGGLAAAALQMARELDDPSNSATSKSMCAKALTELMARIAELAPPVKEADRIDDIAERRRRRLEGQPKPADSARPARRK
jgi:hypothetical protein